jgi:hypothetical protein
MLCGVHAVHWCALLHRMLCCDVCVCQLKIEMPVASQAPPKEAGSGKGGNLKGKGFDPWRKGQRIRQRRRRRLRLRWRHAFLASTCA